MGAIATRARSLLRENVRATFLLAVVAGLAGGLVLATWSTARRGSSSFDRMLAATRQADLMVGFCAKGVTQAELNSESGCPLVDPVAEEEAISRLPGVQAVGRGAVLFGVFELNGSPSDGLVATLLDDNGFPTFAGRPMVIAGRLAEPERRG